LISFGIIPEGALQIKSHRLGGQFHDFFDRDSLKKAIGITLSIAIVLAVIAQFSNLGVFCTPLDQNCHAPKRAYVAGALFFLGFNYQ
jgi:hypothetical protein